MSTNKTVPTSADVSAFLESVENETRRADSFRVLEFMKKVTGEEPQMWGPSIVGFGTYHYKYDSGREGDFLKTGFSPRKSALTLYVMSGFKGVDEIMSKLGKYKTGKSCLYVKKLDDINIDALEQLIRGSLEFIDNKYPS
jgi:hypothetical protein